MSLIIWNILAYLAIIAILGLIGVMIWMASTAMAMVNRVKTIPALIDAPKRSVMETARFAKGLGLRAKTRALSMSGHASLAGQAVMSVKNEVVEIVESLNVDEVKSSVQETTDSMRTGALAISLLRQFLDAAQHSEARGDASV